MMGPQDSSDGWHPVSYTYTSFSQADGQRHRSSTMSETEFASQERRPGVYEPESSLRDQFHGPYGLVSRLAGGHSIDMSLPCGVDPASSCCSSSSSSSSSSTSTSSLSSSSCSSSSSSSPHDAYSAMASSTQSSNACHEAWPSPPLAPGDLDLHYCLHDSSSGLAGVQPDGSYAPASPQAWFPGAPVACPAVRYHDKKVSSVCQALSDACTPAPSGALGLDSSNRNNGYFAALDGDEGNAVGYIWGMDIISPLNTLEASPMAWSDSIADSPMSVGTPKDVLPSQVIETRSIPWPVSAPASASASTTTSASASASTSASASASASGSASASPLSEGNTDLREAADGDKVDEPYAKLIYRAIMSRPHHSMTLQEIYKWFRENTSKAVTESRGWQNSIRHNLSMNAAFSKKEKALCKTVKSGSGSEDSKRVNEWVLEDWAICNGVQSTTRYRKSTYARRPPSGRATSAATNPWAPEHSAKRALSGRKGGCATRASRQRMRTYGQGARLDDPSQHALDLGRASPALSAPPTAYGFGHVKSMQYLAFFQPYPEALAGGCGDEATSGSRHSGLAAGPSFPQLSTNNSNLHHAPHTVGTYHETASCLDMSFGPSDGPNSCAKYREGLLTCTSSSPSPSMCRPYGIPGDAAHAWWPNSQYL